MPMFINALTYLPFFINILKAFDFPLPANAETVSQPVNACGPIRDLRKSCRLVPGGKSLAIWSLTDLIFIILLLEPLPAFMYAASNVLLWLRMRTRTSILSAWIMHGPWTCFAWRIIRVSASSWLLCNSGTASSPVDPNFQHSSPRVTNSNLLSNLDVNSGFFHSDTINFTTSVLFEDTDKIYSRTLPESLVIYFCISHRLAWNFA